MWGAERKAGATRALLELWVQGLGGAWHSPQRGKKVSQQWEELREER
jgi:hypothetical protein